MDNNIRNFKNRLNFIKAFVFFLFLIIIILFVITGYFYYQYQRLNNNPLTSQITAQEEAKKISAEIGKLMLLPNDEIPTIATVTDIEKLKDQQFFKNAANGHKVLIYPNSKLAIIYDPETKLIINVGPINFSQQDTQPVTPQVQQVQNARVGLRNGTNIEGLTYKIETEISKAFPDVEIVLRDQDKRTDFDKTIVIVLNDSVKNVAEEMAKQLNSNIENLPEGDTKPSDVDILIIVGKDKN